MAVLNSIISFLGANERILDGLLKTVPGKMWHVLILEWFDFIVDYGWRIVVFTVLLKLLLSPLDFYQRYKMHKNQKITERLKPTMEKIQKQYGDNKQAFSQKQMELNRKEGYSYFSACLPMIVTLVVFITLWQSMTTVGQYMTFLQYGELHDTYYAAYEQIYDEDSEEVKNLTDEEKATRSALATAVGQDVVYKLYYDGIDEKFVAELVQKYELSADFTLETADKVQADFLWIDNIWSPDVPWGSNAILNWDSFKTGIGMSDKVPDKYKLSQEENAEINAVTYNAVMGKLIKSPKRTANGYLILPILVVLFSVASQLLSMFQQKRAGQVNAKGGAATSMKVMMFLMPLMMVFFALRYASIFTLYMVVNSASSLFINFASTAIVKAVYNRKHRRNYGIGTGSTRSAIVYKKSPIIHYVKGANPNAGAREIPLADPIADVDVSEPTDKKARKAARRAKKDSDTRTVKRSGRPDPHELLGMSVQTKDKKKK